MPDNVPSEPATDLDRLFQWQERALDAWEASGRRGIVEGMTGTGKTIVGVKAIKRLQAQGVRASPLIVVPTVALLNQWCERLRKEFPGAAIGLIGDGSHGDFSKGIGGALPVACVATVHSAVAAVERGLFDHCGGPGTDRSFLIADECHRYLNEDQTLFNRILRPFYAYTLGLSATIDRFEVPGLGKIVFTYNVNDAVRDGVIPHFDVLNVGVELSRDELAQYLELGDRIRDLLKRLRELDPVLDLLDGDLFWGRLRQMLSDEDDPLVRALFGCIFKRAAISYTAVAKLRLVPQIIELLVNRARRKMLVFFERIWTAETGQEDVVRRVAEQVRDRVTVTGAGWVKDPIWCKLFHSGMKDAFRDAVLAEFREIGPSALLACRSLDEGLDVPAVDAALLVASTQSPRQRLQRIGRTLRRGDGRKRPLVVILYVKGTSDTDVRVSPGDPQFKEAATVHDAEPKRCLEAIARILGTETQSPASPRPPADQPAQAATPSAPVPDDGEWDLLLDRSTGGGLARLNGVGRRTALKLELTGGEIVRGEWKMLMSNVLFLDKPLRQVAFAKVMRVWRARR